MTDIRERFEAFDRVEPPPELWNEAHDREPRSEPQRGGRGKKAVVILTAFAVTAAATGVLIRTFDRDVAEPPVAGPVDTWPTTSLPRLGLSFRSPQGWRVQPFGEEIGTIWFQGALVSNTDLTFGHATPSDGGATSAWDLSRLPADGVVVSIEQISGGPPPPISASPSSDTALPLDLSNAKLLAPQPDPLGSSPKPEGTEERYLEFVRAQRGDDVRVFFGPQASPESRAAAAAIVASIEPKALGEGQVAVEIPSPQALEGASGALWVVSGLDTLEKRDASSGELLATLHSASSGGDLSSAPFATETLTSGFGSVWWLQRTSLLRIDPATMDVQTRIDLSSPGTVVTTGDGSVWVGVEDGYDLRIDPATDTIVSRTSPPSSPSGSLAIGGGFIWSNAYSEGARIERYEVDTGAFVSADTLPASSLVFSNGGLWGLTGSSVERFSADTGEVTQEIPVQGTTSGLTASGTSLWVNDRGVPIQIEAMSGDIVGTPIEPSLRSTKNGDISVAGDMVWLVVPGRDEIEAFPT